MGVKKLRKDFFIGADKLTVVMLILKNVFNFQSSSPSKRLLGIQ